MNPLRQSFVLALLLIGASAAAASGGAPEGAHLSQLDSKLSVAKRARITTSGGVAWVSEMRATPAGISYHNLMVSQGSDSLRRSGVIEWKDIREVETTDGRPSLWLRPWTLALAGGGLGLVAFSAAGGTTTSWSVNQSPTPFVVIGAAVGYGGGLFAKRFGSHWRSIYP